MRVTKASRETEDFRPEKIKRTCLRADVPLELAERITEEIERKSYDGISTKEILRMIIKLLERKMPYVAARYDLKNSIFRLGSAGFTFEHFVSEVLKEYGYSTKKNQIIKGASVQHEIDVVASKNDKNYMIECKYHNLPGIYTGLKVALYTYARFLDLRDGWKMGLCQRFDQPWLVCNTKFSQDTIHYADHKRINLIGWKYPVKNGLEILIEKKRLYPITILRTLDKNSQNKLANVGFVMVIDLLRRDLEELNEITKIQVKELKKFVEEVEKICS
jgi:Holliday junction resolvase